jgi:hypothetical protein
MTPSSEESTCLQRAEESTCLQRAGA